LAGNRLGKGSGETSLANTENGQAATLTCQAGVARIEAVARSRSYHLTTRQLSEVCFGLLPLDLLLPGLPPDAPIRQVLPARIFISEFFAL